MSRSRPWLLHLRVRSTTIVELGGKGSSVVSVSDVPENRGTRGSLNPYVCLVQRMIFLLRDGASIYLCRPEDLFQGGYGLHFLPCRFADYLACGGVLPSEFLLRASVFLVLLWGYPCMDLIRRCYPPREARFPSR